MSKLVEVENQIIYDKGRQLTKIVFEIVTNIYDEIFLENFLPKVIKSYNQCQFLYYTLNYVSLE